MAGNNRRNVNVNSKQDFTEAWADFLEKEVTETTEGEAFAPQDDVAQQEAILQPNEMQFRNVQPARQKQQGSQNTYKRVSTQPGPKKPMQPGMDDNLGNTGNIPVGEVQAMDIDEIHKNLQEEMMKDVENMEALKEEQDVVSAEENQSIEVEEIIAENDDSQEEKSSKPEDKLKDLKNKAKKDKKEKKDKKDLQIDELQEKIVRTMAEFDNFRKRTEKEKALMFEIGAKSIIEKILPVIDNFERGFDALSDEDKENAFVQGFDKIYKQMISTLEEVGVKVIDAKGKEFDPEYHNAVMHVDDEEMGENVVADVFQKGYMYRESVVRHSMVKVAN